jgi:hypothetical protein
MQGLVAEFRRSCRQVRSGELGPLTNFVGRGGGALGTGHTVVAGGVFDFGRNSVSILRQHFRFHILQHVGRVADARFPMARAFDDALR